MGYVFDPDELNEIVQNVVASERTLEERFDGITAALAERYPKYVDTRPRNWIFNNAGGAMGQLTLLHLSLSEYLIFFGSPIGTEGHSGRYATEVYDIMIRGEIWTYLEGDTERQVNRPGGDYLRLGRSLAKGYKIPSDGWMLEYARGPIPSMVPFGLMDMLTSTLDFRAFARTLRQYARLTTSSLLKGKL